MSTLAQRRHLATFAKARVENPAVIEAQDAAVAKLDAWLSDMTHQHTGPVIENDRLVCETCHTPVYVQTSVDMDSAWLVAW